MQCEVSPWSACGPLLQEVWSGFESRALIQGSPFLTWEFFDSVARVRGDVEVAIFREGGEIVGCFPFERKGGRQALPVAGLLNDLHGPIAAGLGEEDFSRILRLARLTRFDFHAAPTMPWNSAIAISREVPGYRARLGDQPGKYIEHLMSERYSIRQQKRKTRAMERKLGPIRMEWRTRDASIFETLLSWKSQQYRRTGRFDIFALPWARQLAHDLLRLDAGGMHGQISALFAGNELVAVHLALRYRDTLHCWFPAYSVEHSRFSPGTELFLRMAAQAPSEGIALLDMGSGTEPYKEKFTNEQYSVIRGSLDLLPWRRKLRSLSFAASQQAMRIPWMKGARQWVRQTMSSSAANRFQ
jgi:CelD/BcsL family acetyltransferase involved in cellulose biosynthesis